MALSTMLVVISGLPGVGKTSLATRLARALDGSHLCIDSIEHAIRRTRRSEDSVEAAAYAVAYAIAMDNLNLGRTIIADCVNPSPNTRAAWRDLANQTGVAIVEVEVICSEASEHRRRVESRRPDTPGSKNPTWQEVLAREYAPWDRERVVIDSANQDVEQSVTALHALLLLRERSIR